MTPNLRLAPVPLSTGNPSSSVEERRRSSPSIISIPAPLPSVIVLLIPPPQPSAQPSASTLCRCTSNLRARKGTESPTSPALRVSFHRRSYRNVICGDSTVCLRLRLKDTSLDLQGIVARHRLSSFTGTGVDLHVRSCLRTGVVCIEMLAEHRTACIAACRKRCHCLGILKLQDIHLRIP